jgi:hypothetical protein
MSNIGPVGGDVNYTPIQKRLSPAPLPKETSSVTTPDTIVSKSFINRDQFIPADIANSALPPTTEKNSNVDNAWFAVKAETTNANAVLPPVLNAKPGAPINKLTESSPQETKLVIAKFMENPDSRGSIIIDGLA